MSGPGQERLATRSERPVGPDSDDVTDSAAPAPPRPALRGRRLLGIGLGASALFLLILVLVIAGGQYRTDSSSLAPGGSAAGTQDTAVGEARPVQVLKPQRRDLVRSLSLPANISPFYQATLYAKVPGYLKWIGVDKGDQVRQGQLLAVIDAPEIEDQYKQAEADYAIKKITHERYLSVWKDNPDMIAKQDVDMAAAAAEAAKHVRDSRRTLLSYTKVYAPFSGVITARFADPGALIQAAVGSATQAAPLLTIMDTTTVRVYASVPQEAALLAKPGVPASLTVDELPDRTFTGAITRTTEALDPATRTLLVEIDLPNEAHLLHPGMFGTATLDLERHAHALALPPAAIVTGKDAGDAAVFVVERGRTRKVPVKTGIDDGVWIEITEGLTGDEDVVVVGKAALADGQAVEAVPYNLPSGKPARQKM